MAFILLPDQTMMPRFLLYLKGDQVHVGMPIAETERIFSGYRSRLNYTRPLRILKPAPEHLPSNYTGARVYYWDLREDYTSVVLYFKDGKVTGVYPMAD